MRSKLREVIITINGQPSEESLKKLAKTIKKIYINKQS